MCSNKSKMINNASYQMCFFWQTFKCICVCVEGVGVRIPPKGEEYYSL